MKKQQMKIIKFCLKSLHEFYKNGANNNPENDISK